jgi:hypothetical protein
MLSQERIPIGKLRQAYRLNTQEADALISALARRDCIEPYELWHEAVCFVAVEENNKKSIYDEVDEPHFPGVSDLKQDLLQQRIATKRLLRHFLFSARAGTPKEHSQKIFDRVLHYTYDEPGEQDIDSVNQILDSIYDQRHFGFHEKDKVDILAGAYVSPVLYAKFCSFFDDAIAANKEAAVLHLFEHGYSWDHAVKGLSKEIVERILATAATAVQAQTTHATPSPEPSSTAIFVPRALWNGKTPQAVRDAMTADYPRNIITHILYTRCNITNKSYIAKLLDIYPKKVTKYLAEAAVMKIVDS